ncbi:MAG: hypothetical protein GY782_06510 [Gammaproteobacteria bacterium]|nr:hypothetical protein [Gammaproteobacteria bacterium]
MGRYYNRQGEFQEGAGLREARKQDLVPSVTTIIGDTINKEFLNKWKVDQHLGISVDYNIEMFSGDEKRYKEAIKDAFNQDTTAVDFGNEVHKALEDTMKYYRVNDYCSLILPDIKANRDLKILGHDLAADIHFDIIKEKKVKVSVEKQVVGSGYSGTIDLLIETKDRVFIIDYKTQNKEIGKCKKYEEWLIQLAAYSMAVQRDIKKPVTCYNIIINRELEYKFVKYSYKDLCRGKRMFKATFQLWQEYKKFYCEVKK